MSTHTPTPAELALGPPSPLSGAPRMQSLGVAFDGRCYRYRDYRYERAIDAINYAKLDRTRPDYQVLPYAPPTWSPWPQPSPAEQLEMTQLAIHHEGGHYRYREYRYEQYQDAIQYARRKR